MKNPYKSMSQVPSASEESGGRRMKPPVSLVWMLWLGILAAVVGTIGWVAGVALISDADKDRIYDEIKRQTTDPDLDMTREQLDSAFNIALIVVLVLALLLSALWLWGVIKAYRGRTWAQIMTTILGGLWVLSTVSLLTNTGPKLGSGFELGSISQLSGPSLAVAVAATVLQLLLALGTVVALHLPASRRFFNDVKRTGL